ncbi:zinc finger (C3HC4-type RING finger) family protein, partial [Tanacetum coccineum]
VTDLSKIVETSFRGLLRFKLEPSRWVTLPERVDAVCGFIMFDGRSDFNVIIERLELGFKELFRGDGMKNRYSILVKFEDQKSTDVFHKHFNGRRFSYLETHSCRALSTDMQYTRVIEHTHTSRASTELASCPVSLGGISTKADTASSDKKPNNSPRSKHSATEQRRSKITGEPSSQSEYQVMDDNLSVNINSIYFEYDCGLIVASLGSGKGCGKLKCEGLGINMKNDEIFQVVVDDIMMGAIELSFKKVLNILYDERAINHIRVDEQFKSLLLNFMEAQFHWGFILDMGVYYIAGLRMMVGREVGSVSAMTSHADTALSPPDTISSIFSWLIAARTDSKSGQSGRIQNVQTHRRIDKDIRSLEDLRSSSVTKSVQMAHQSFLLGSTTIFLLLVAGKGKPSKAKCRQLGVEAEEKSLLPVLKRLSNINNSEILQTKKMRMEKKVDPRPTLAGLVFEEWIGAGRCDKWSVQDGAV